MERDYAWPSWGRHQPKESQLDRIERKLGDVVGALGHVLQTLGVEVSAFDDLKAAVTASDAANEATMTTIATYLEDIAGQVTGGLSESDASALAEIGRASCRERVSKQV